MRLYQIIGLLKDDEFVKLCEILTRWGIPAGEKYRVNGRIGVTHDRDLLQRILDEEPEIKRFESAGLRIVEV